MATHNDDFLSDDEIFFGKMTIKEVKTHFKKDMHRHSVSCNITKEDDENETADSFKLIETCSEPDHKLSSSFNDSDLCSSNELKGATSKWNINSTNNSFSEKEKIVSEIDMHSTNEQKCLDNKLNLVDFILDNAPSIKDINLCQNEAVHSNDIVSNSPNVQHLKEKFQEANISLTEKEPKCKVINNDKVTIQLTPENSTEYLNSNIAHNQIYTTNETESLTKKILDKTGLNVNNFKTPKANFSAKKPEILATNKTPSKRFKNVISPVATYIKSTQVSTVRNITLTKPLRGTSSIPKRIKSDTTKPCKEYVSLRFVAHKSAKKMIVINSPAAGPDKINAISPWKKHLPSPLVIKHVQKEDIHSSKKTAEYQQEESFADLVLH